MKGAIMGGTLFSVLLLLIIGGTNRHQCEASAIAMAENSSGILNTTSEGIVGVVGNGNNSLVDGGDHHVVPVSAADLPKVDSNNGTILANISTIHDGTNGTDVIKVTIDEAANSTTEHGKKPCPLPNPSLPRKDGDEDDDDHKDGNDRNSTTVKDEKHETALEKIGESITNFASTVKKSFTSIFRPGSGLGRHEEVDCVTNGTIIGEGNSTSNGNSSDIINTNGTGNVSNVTLDSPAPSPAEVGGKDQDQFPKLEGANLLIHSSVSNNDSISVNNATIGNETNGTITSTTTMLPLPASGMTEMSTPAPAPVVA